MMPPHQIFAYHYYPIQSQFNPTQNFFCPTRLSENSTAHPPINVTKNQRFLINILLSAASLLSSPIGITRTDQSLPNYWKTVPPLGPFNQLQPKSARDRQQHDYNPPKKKYFFLITKKNAPPTKFSHSPTICPIEN